MNPESMSTSIQCDDHAETLVFERSIWGKDDELNCTLQNGHS